MARDLIGLILDTGPLIAADRNDRRFWAFWKRSIHAGLDLRVPATVLAQAWRGPTNARMALVLGACGVEALTERVARRTGELCGRARTSDIVDAHVVLSAHDRGYGVVTCDAHDLGLLARLLGSSIKILDFNELR